MYTSLYSSLISQVSTNSISNYKQLLNDSQYWNSHNQIKYQNEKLKRLIQFAYNNIPYYSRIFNSKGIKPCDIKSLNDLETLPVLTKDIIRKNFHDLIYNKRKRDIQKRKTGGTTGEPLVYYSDTDSWSLHWALKYRAWEWAGYKTGMPLGLIGGASIIPDKTPSFKRKVWNYLNGFYPLPASHLSPDMMYAYASTIKHNRIQYLRGYPSSISHFAQFCIDNSIKLDIKGVIVTAEVLRDDYKESIKRAFNPILIDTYGCADGGGNANTCRYDSGFHISIEASIWEVCDVNGNRVPEGELGELTLTSLTNYAMPMIRYQPGDLIENSFDYAPCPCGCTLPRIKKIYGRSTDILTFSNNRSLGGPAITLLFRDFPILNYQLVQNAHNSLDINIVPKPEFNENDSSRIKKIMEHHCGLGVNVNISITDSILLPPSGKHRFIINNTK
jgi:phenylacetate-CoA ligase